MASVELIQIHKTFGKTGVIHGVDLVVEDGEFVSLVGPSGCGKSTILRMIAGLESVTKGTITIDGDVVNNVPPKDRNVAMVFQSYALYPHMTVYNNIAFSLKQRKTPKGEISKLVRETALNLGLTDLLERYPRQLSGGQRQRVAMGRAIVRNPALFLFDEPLSNLDAKLRVQMRAEIKQLCLRLKTTSIYVTHDQIEAMTMSDRIVVLNRGKVEQIGSPLDLFDLPSNMFVAQFIGSPAMNFFEGYIAQNNDQFVFQANDGFVIPFNAKLERSSEKVILGIRPQHIQICQHETGLNAEVLVVEPTGTEVHLHCRLGNQEVDIILNDRLPCKPGEKVSLKFDSNHMHLFFKETQKRINFTNAPEKA